MKVFCTSQLEVHFQLDGSVLEVHFQFNGSVLKVISILMEVYWKLTSNFMEMH